MRIARVVSLARRLSTPAIVRRGRVVSILVLVERLLTPAVAWAFFGRSLIEKAVLAVALSLVFSGRTFVQTAFRWRTEADLMNRVVSSVIRGDVLRANVLPKEDARSELGQAVYHAAQSVSVDVPLLLADALAATPLTLLIVAGEPGRLLVVAVAMTLLAAVALLATRRSMEAALESTWAAHDEVLAGFVDALEGKLDVVASGRRAAFLAEMDRRTQAWGRAGTRLAGAALASGKLPLLAIAAAVASGVALVEARRHGAPEVTTADMALLASMTPAFSGIAQGVFAVLRAERWMDSVESVLAERPVDAGGAVQSPHLPAPVVFERVSFRYGGMLSDALTDVTFTWEREHLLALAGANGSGKSTCLRLLLGLARPSDGEIRIGCARMDELDADAWRSSIAFLPQRPYLPPRSDVRAAMRFLAPETNDEGLRRALDRVGILASLERVKVDPLAARIDGLSIGERQRVALARLLCQKASLVLLDEPDANLDRAGIAMVANVLRELARSGMAVVVAHSAELLEIADRVIVLDRGRVVRDESFRK